MNKYAIILAAGRGSRMKSRNPDHSKVSFPILGKPMIDFVLDAVDQLEVDEKVVVVGFGGDVTSSIVGERAKIVWQTELKGTGDAVLRCAPLLEGKKGSTIIVCADTPLLTAETIDNLFKKHEKSQNSLTILTAFLQNPKGYGRVLREEKSNFIKGIREDRDCSIEEEKIHEINSGVYVVDNEALFKYLKFVTPNNSQKEYYLTDIVQMMVDDNLPVGSYVLEDSKEIFGINDRNQLAYASKIIRHRTNKALMLSGVSIEDPDTTYISPDVKIGGDTIIKSNTTILGNCSIGEANVLGPDTYLENVTVGNENKIIRSYITDSSVGNSNEIGPFTKIRTNSNITDSCRIGNFVELKNATLKPGVKCAHLTYLGDCEVGERTNVGCMTVTANYDGYHKNKTTIGKDVFVGSGSILIAPVTIEDNGFTAAGSTITNDVKSDEMAIARAKQVNIAHGSSKYKDKTKGEE